MMATSSPTGASRSVSACRHALETAGSAPEMIHGLTGGRLEQTDERSAQVSPLNMLGTDWRKQQKRALP